MVTDSAVATLSVAVAVTLVCISLSQHCYYCCFSAVTVSAVTSLSVPSLSQRCTRLCCCHSATLVCDVITPCSFALSQRCARFHCHSAVLVFAVTTLCLFSLPQCYTRFRCHNAVHIGATVYTRCGVPVLPRFRADAVLVFPFDGRFNILEMVRNIFSVFTRTFLTAELICFFCQVQLFAKCKHPAESWCRPDPGQQSGHDPPALCGQEGHQANGQTVSRPQRCRYQRSGQFLPYTVAPCMYPWQQSSCSVTAQQERRREGNVR